MLQSNCVVWQDTKNVLCGKGELMDTKVPLLMAHLGKRWIWKINATVCKNRCSENRYSQTRSKCMENRFGHWRVFAIHGPHSASSRGSSLGDLPVIYIIYIYIYIHFLARPWQLDHI